MASVKSIKGNPFEYDTAYSLQQNNFEVNRIDDNTKGIDLIATGEEQTLFIECKFHQKFTWNELIKIFHKTFTTSQSINREARPLLIFKSNQQPVLVMFLHTLGIPTIMEFKHYFKTEWSKRPKGYKLWKNS